MLSIQERLKLPTEPFEGSLWQWLCMLRCAIPGRVVSFDPDTQTCVVQPMIQELILLPAPGATDTTQNIPTNETIKPIQDVPIMMMRVPGWSLTFPIVVGTECLVIFADTCIDGWWETGNISPIYDRRRHDLSDGFALFGPWSKPNKLSSYSTTSVQLRSDDQLTMIELSSTAINIKSSSKVVIQAPEVDANDSGGTPKVLVNDTWFQWWSINIFPFLQGLGYIGPGIPTSSETTVLKGQ